MSRLKNFILFFRNSILLQCTMDRKLIFWQIISFLGYLERRCFWHYFLKILKFYIILKKMYWVFI